MIEQYKLMHQKFAGYGNGASHLSRIKRFIADHDVQTILDYGCGKGALSKHLPLVFNYDPAIPEFSGKPSVMFDMVVCNDVMEHLYEDNYQSVIDEIDSYAIKVIFYAISCRPAVHKMPNGENCHTLVRDPEWWKERIPHQDSVWIESNKCLLLTVIK